MLDYVAKYALLFSSIGLLSMVIPIGIFIGRNNVRSIRWQLVDDLAKLFSFAKEQGGTPLIVPSFELIKYKYNLNRDPIPDIELGGSRLHLCAFVLPGIYHGFRRSQRDRGVEGGGAAQCLPRGREDRPEGGRTRRRADLCLPRRLSVDGPVSHSPGRELRPETAVVRAISHPYPVWQLRDRGGMACRGACSDPTRR